MHSVAKKVIKRKSSDVPEVVVKNKVKKVDTIVKVKKSATKAELFLSRNMMLWRKTTIKVWR